MNSDRETRAAQSATGGCDRTNEAGAVSPLIVAIDEAVSAQRALEQQLRREFGINNTDFRALMLVFRARRASHATRVGDFTRVLGLSSGAASQSATRLRAAGLLQREPDPRDRRTGALTLTQAAQRRLDDAGGAVQVDLDRIIATVPMEEQQRIISLLNQVRDAFDHHQKLRRSSTPQ